MTWREKRCTHRTGTTGNGEGLGLDRRTFAKSVLTLVAGGLTATVIDATDSPKDKQTKILWKIHRRQPDGTWIQVRMRELAIGDVFKIESNPGELMTPTRKPFFHKESGF